VGEPCQKVLLLRCLARGEAYVVSSDATLHFYAERETLPEPTPWVKQVVYPRLQRDSAALPDLEMSCAIRHFLDGVDKPCICYDADQDRDLCTRLLMLTETDAATTRQLTWDKLTETGAALERWWQSHPDERRMRHHALTDAKALRAAWLSLWGI
jgi:hypothetical protein